MNEARQAVAQALMLVIAIELVGRWMLYNGI